MINEIKSAYNHCDDDHCHQTINTSFYLNDRNNGKCSFSTNPVNSTCFIENKNKIRLDFFAIDECLVKSNAVKKCDALVSGKSTMWFIELKEVIWSDTNPQANVTKRRNGRIKAVKQIASTINHFKSKGVNLNDIVVVGLVSFSPLVQSYPITIPTTSSQARILEFSQLCGYTNFYEGNHIVF